MAGEAGPRGAQPSPSAPPSPPEPVGPAPAYPPPTGPAHGREYPSDEDGDGPYKTEGEGTADAEALAVGRRAASVASGGADAEGRTGHGHVNLADVDDITLTTAEGVGSRRAWPKLQRAEAVRRRGSRGCRRGGGRGGAPAASGATVQLASNPSAGTVLLVLPAASKQVARCTAEDPGSAPAIVVTSLRAYDNVNSENEKVLRVFRHMIVNNKKES